MESTSGRPDAHSEEPRYLSATEYDGSKFAYKILTVPEEFFDTYVPVPEVIAARPDPDPFEYVKRYGALMESSVEAYLDSKGKEVSDLSWTERLILSEGHVPYSLIGRALLASFVFHATTDVRAQLKQEHRKLLLKKEGMRIVSGLRVGEIIEIEDIPGSHSGQRLAKVLVGTKLDENGKEIEDVRQVVCGGSNVLKQGHRVVVALPGARILSGGKLRERNWKIPAEDGSIVRYRSEAMLCSEYEAFSLQDEREKKKDQVLILPSHPQLQPGVPLDRVIIKASQNPYREGAIPKLGLAPEPVVRGLVRKSIPPVRLGRHLLWFRDSREAEDIMKLVKSGASEKEIESALRQQILNRQAR